MVGSRRKSERAVEEDKFLWIMRAKRMHVREVAQFVNLYFSLANRLVLDGVQRSWTNAMAKGNPEAAPRAWRTWNYNYSECA